MKLAFTTLGCPKWDMDRIISRAVEYGYDGVDFRGYLGEMKIYELPEFKANAKETAQRFVDANLEVPCFSSSIHAFTASRNDLNKCIDEARAYADVCQPFNTPAMRVFGGSIGETPRPEAIEILASNLNKISAAIKGSNVQLLLESHDSWLDCRYLKEVMAKTDPALAGILWDTHHPYRKLDEAPTKTWETLGPRIKNTHFKDSTLDKKSDLGYQLCLIGEGDIPLKEIMRCLKNGGYAGYLTLEWEKAWHPDIAEPEIAFPGYIKIMREFI